MSPDLIEAVARLGRALVEAECLEDAASELLTCMLSRTAVHLRASSYRRHGSVTRGMVHLRPGGDYRGLVVLEEGATAPTDPSDRPELVTSTSAWRAVATQGVAVALDVEAGVLTTVDGAELGTVTASAGAQSGGTLQRLQGRATTHMLAVPLRGSGSSVRGMVSIEASCSRAIGRPFIWEEVEAELQLLADLAAASLSMLPSRSRGRRVHDDLLPVVGSSMASTVAMLEVFAQQPETVLLSGPTGVGKSRLARWCHARSSRAERPFETLDVLGIGEDMQMAELFGHRRGAFTGATQDRPGLVERAECGTLFLDEIDKLSLKAQAGLLQLLETRRYRALGDAGSPRTADVRFIVGTNADLAERVGTGEFREDLYYRINVLPVRVPPLSDRAEEIADWAQFMATRRHRESGADGDVLVTAEAAHALERAPWPGNLRQLDNVVRRAYALALMQGVEPGGALTLGLQQFALALSSEAPVRGGTVLGTLLGTMQAAARMFYEEAARRASAEGVLSLDHADAFTGLVLQAAIEGLGDAKDALVLLGKEQLVTTRNHSRVLRREAEKVTALLDDLES